MLHGGSIVAMAPVVSFPIACRLSVLLPAAGRKSIINHSTRAWNEVCRMLVSINGQWQEVSATSVSELLATLKLEPRRVAVERNRQIVPRARYEQTALEENDQFEIVTLVGGG
jgi:thiamine biosynthesis protein ThiS